MISPPGWQVTWRQKNEVPQCRFPSLKRKRSAIQSFAYASGSDSLSVAVAGETVDSFADVFLQAQVATILE